MFSSIFNAGPAAIVGGEKTEGKKGSAVMRSPLNYGVPDGDPATCHAKPRNDDAVKSMAGSTVE